MRALVYGTDGLVFQMVNWVKSGSGTLLVIGASELPVLLARPNLFYLTKHSNFMEGDMSLTHDTHLEVRPLMVEDAPTCDQIILTLPRQFWARRWTTDVCSGGADQRGMGGCLRWGCRWLFDGAASWCHDR
jgi:hypothetical protein